jgi:catecholate siderophore receptor
MNARLSPDSPNSGPNPRLNRSAAASAALTLANAIMMAGTLHAQSTPPETQPSTSTADNPLQLEPVEVRDNHEQVGSPKFTEPVLDTPQTIDVIPPEVYSAQGATTLSDVLRNTPGITFFAGEGGSANRTGGDSFYLRGFDTSNSIFVDGVRDEGAAVHDTFDIDQVEVFKGPSSDNGRGGTAGYINLETKMPEVTAFQDAVYSHGFGADGSSSSDRATLDIDQPLAGSPVAGTALRLNLMDQDGGVPGREFAENNRWGVAPSLALGLGTATRALVSYEHQYEHNLPDYGLPSTAVAGFAPPATLTAPSFYSPGVNPANYYGFVDYDYEHVTNDAVTARVEHDFDSGLKLDNQTRYDVTSRQVEASSASGSVTAAPDGDASLSQGIYQTQNEILSNQTNLTASFRTGPLTHDLTSGLELSRETADNPTWSLVPLGFASPAYLVNIYSPLDFPGALPNYDPHLTGSATDTRINTEALYAFDTVKPNKFWEVIGGLRLEHYDVNELDVTAASPAIAATALVPPTATALGTAATTAAAAVPPSSVDLSAGQTTLSGNAGLVFKPAPDGSLYLTYDTSIRPPGTSSSTNTLSTTTTSADDPLLQPEKAINYEAGAKWNFFHDRLLADFALFRSVNTNVPAADPVTGLVDQTSDQTVQGLELGLSGKITDAWLVLAGYSRLEAVVSNEIATNAQGLTLPLLPKESGNLWTTYRLPLGFTVGGGVQYVGETERLQATTAPTATTFSNQVPSYWIGSGMLSYAADKHLTLRLNVNNIFNREYVASLNNNGYRVNLGTPRTFLVTVELKF